MTPARKSAPGTRRCPGCAVWTAIADLVTRVEMLSLVLPAVWFLRRCGDVVPASSLYRALNFTGQWAETESPKVPKRRTSFPEHDHHAQHISGAQPERPFCGHFGENGPRQAGEANPHAAFRLVRNHRGGHLCRRRLFAAVSPPDEEENLPVSDSGFHVGGWPAQRGPSLSVHAVSVGDRWTRGVGQPLHFIRTSVRVPGGFEQYEGLPHSSLHFLRHKEIWGASVYPSAGEGDVGHCRCVGGQLDRQCATFVRVGQLCAGFPWVFPKERQFLHLAPLRFIFTLFLRFVVFLHPTHIPAAVLQRAPEDFAVPQLPADDGGSRWVPSLLRSSVVFPAQSEQKFRRLQRAKPEFMQDRGQGTRGQLSAPNKRAGDGSCRGHSSCVCAKALLHDPCHCSNHFMDAANGKKISYTFFSKVHTFLKALSILFFFFF